MIETLFFSWRLFHTRKKYFSLLLQIHTTAFFEISFRSSPLHTLSFACITSNLSIVLNLRLPKSRVSKLNALSTAEFELAMDVISSRRIARSGNSSRLELRILCQSAFDVCNSLAFWWWAKPWHLFHSKNSSAEAREFTISFKLGKWRIARLENL